MIIICLLKAIWNLRMSDNPSCEQGSHHARFHMFMICLLTATWNLACRIILPANGILVMLDFISIGFFDRAAKIPNFYPQKNPEKIRVLEFRARNLLFRGCSVSRRRSSPSRIRCIFFVQSFHHRSGHVNGIISIPHRSAAGIA